ncbi:MAG: M4 family metallopeptidase [Chloroflexota bacterium]|nr:M4 family metallopeptidase [Chloroflexota bacterium]
MAANFAVPADLRKSGSRHDAKFNLDFVSYQQYAAPLGTLVDGGQVTVVSRDGKQLLVGGAYYPGLRSTSAPALSVAAALNIAAQVRGGLLDLPDAIRGFATRRTDLRLDPLTGRPFYRVATAAPGNNGYQEIDAQSGELLAAWGGVDQINRGQGVGVKGDTKTLTTSPFNVVGDLTSGTSPYQLQSADGNFITYNANGGNSIPGTLMTDSSFGNDNIWQAATQSAGVDAQYYAALTVQFYSQALGYDWLNCPSVIGWPDKVRSVVHYDLTPGGLPYDNAFWDEQHYYMVYGDGSTADRPLSAGQDVVSHELSHAVTQCTGNLEYRSESGALNESFSDIMATAAEFVMEEPLNSNCRLRPGQTECGDWLIGEDLARTASGAAIRDLADPEAEGQPSHYTDRSFQSTPPNECFSGSDYCDVHHNSGIPNHAFYLLAHGGRNARCSGPTDPKANCDVMVPPTSLDHATQIWFAGLTILTNDATMCDARNSTIAQAALLYPGSVTDIAATILAWQAVGLGNNCDSSTDFKVSLSDPTVALAPGSSGSTHLNLVRGSGLGGDSGTITYNVDKVGPATVTATPPSNAGGNSDGTQIDVTADDPATDGVYPILVTSTGTPNVHYAAAAMVIDAEPPSAAVTGVGFVAMSTVTTGGSIPLNVTWTATDGQSGIASAELDHSPNGSGWVNIGSSSPTQYPTTAGPHQFQVLATDGVGNDATSAAFIRTLTEYQETAPTYTGTWLVSTAATPWGTTRYSTRRRATATLTFTGTSVVWIAQRGFKRGVANVFVDGIKTHVDLYSATTRVSPCRPGPRNRNLQVCR